jgi:hypothetical protein
MKNVITVGLYSQNTSSPSDQSALVANIIDAMYKEYWNDPSMRLYLTGSLDIKEGVNMFVMAKAKYRRAKL